MLILSRLLADGKRTLLVNIDSDACKPEGWESLADEKPDVVSFSDISIYELHVRDFRSPLVSFLYERSWRQNFNRAGFPRPDEEMAHDFFRPAEGGILVDVSCGSGLFSRKFAKSEVYSKVIALDFSENMLRQSYDFIKDDDTILKS
ncbi:hypothetical protein POM88_000327 [Heracleum sosnowskyi]|uniref:Methyltransferase domain-containing protein n=1 Tax=Heracleum sosnowskyi TaxID=360622 RepID=A0AAD8JE44_9APIA|nr:hypothetical protein POM88_000327 [Heracleum sosnowskyi]